MARSNASPKARGKDWIRLAVFNLTTCIGRFHTRLQNGRFFLKISKDIGKTWGKSLTRAKRAILTRERKTPSVPGLTLRFQPRSRPFVWLLEQTLRTVLQSTFTLQTGFLSETGRKMIRINKLQGSLQASLINNTGWMLQRIKFYPKVVRVTKDYKILKTKEYGMTQCY